MISFIYSFDVQYCKSLQITLLLVLGIHTHTGILVYHRFFSINIFFSLLLLLHHPRGIEKNKIY